MAARMRGTSARSTPVPTIISDPPQSAGGSSCVHMVSGNKLSSLRFRTAGGGPSTVVIPWRRTVHIPDGFLSTPVWAALDTAAVPAVYLIARRAQRGFDEAKAPLLGVMGAFVFAAQMIN